MNNITVRKDYLERLEQAVLTAEWWVADAKVAARKESGQRKSIFAAADMVRQAKLERDESRLGEEDL